MSARARSPLPWLAALLAVYLLAPLVAFAVRLGHGAPGAPGLGSALAVSALTASASTLVIALLGIPLAYLLARGRGRGSALLGVLVQLPLALPPLMSGILLLLVVGPLTPLGRLLGGRLTDSAVGIVLAQTFVAAPFGIVAARSAFAAVDPALEDVAASLGHGRLGRFARLAVPVALPGLQAALLLAWLRAFGEFGATVILAYHPFSLPVYTYVQFSASGLASTLLPVAAALGAALVLLAGAHLRARLPRRRAVLPAPVEPAPRPAPALAFALRARLGAFTLDLAHAARSPRLALLGPSGAGKSLTLRLLAGLAPAERGEVRAGSLVLGDLAPERRDVGYVPQSAALVPGRTVWRQVTFGVGADPGLAAWWLERLELRGLEDRLPDELSGGQQRRVALARALARDPRLLLLDEPFSGLDAPVRERLRRDLRRLQREVGLSTVLVTHEAEEAALLADELVVLDAGRGLQAGPPAAVLGRPGSPRVARLLGVANVGTGTVLEAGRLDAGGAELPAPTGELYPGARVAWCLRAERIALDPGGELAGVVVDRVELGVAVELVVLVGAGLELTVRAADAPDGLTPGASCRLHVPAEAVTAWAAEGEARPAARSPQRTG